MSVQARDYEIAKLDEANYGTWRIQMEWHLRGKGLEPHIQVLLEEANQDGAWSRADAEVASPIFSTHMQ